MGARELILMAVELTETNSSSRSSIGEAQKSLILSAFVGRAPVPRSMFLQHRDAFNAAV
jgi:hypothetical protein